MAGVGGGLRSRGLRCEVFTEPLQLRKKFNNVVEGDRGVEDHDVRISKDYFVAISASMDVRYDGV